MTDYLQDFYDNKVDNNAIQKGTLGYFYYKLNKFEKSRSEIVVDFLKRDKDSLTFNSILDIGCNEGSFIEKITRTIKCKGFYGIDISEKAIAKCRDKFPEFLNNFSVENIDSGLSFENKKFDLITMLAVLEHTFDPLFVMSEVSRIVKKGGLFIVEVPNIAFIRHRINLLLGKRPRTSWDYGWDGGHLQYFDRKDLKKLLENSGFKIIEVTGSGIFQNFRKWYGSMLLADITIIAKKL